MSKLVDINLDDTVLNSSQHSQPQQLSNPNDTSMKMTQNHKPGNPFINNYDNKSNINMVKKVLNETRIATDNAINKAINRTEQLTPLINKTQDLSSTSFNFKRSSIKIRKQIWCDNFKKKTCLIITIILVIVGIIILILHETNKHKTHNDSFI